MNVRARFTLPLACLFALTACGSTEPKDARGLLFEGMITDAATGAPIPGTGVGVGDGSQIGLPSLTETSDAQGHYTLSHARCINSPYLNAFATGYYYASVQVVCKAERQTVNISLTRDPTSP